MAENLHAGAVRPQPRRRGSNDVVQRVRAAMRFGLLVLATITLLTGTSVIRLACASEVQFNVTCPASALLPSLDTAYHECNHGWTNRGCERFVQNFQKLLPRYDCQRPFDATPTQNYTVPAVWLAGDAAVEDYVDLLWRLASSKDKRFEGKPFSKATFDARKLFASQEFRDVLDGAVAEEYLPRSRKIERELGADPPSRATIR
jgi:hypothetical protein